MCRVVIPLLLCFMCLSASAKTPLPCELIANDDIEKASEIQRHTTFKRAYRLLKSAGTSPKRHMRAFLSLQKALNALLTEAERVFHDVPQRSWTDKEKRRANAFLKAHVFGTKAALHLGELGFEPSDALAYPLMRSACFANNHEQVVTWGRRGSSTEALNRRAFAALTLNQLQRGEEAQLLIQSMAPDSFLKAFAISKLHASDAQRRAAETAAQRFAKSELERSLLMVRTDETSP